MQGNSKAAANFENLKFAACEFGNSHRRSNEVNTINNNPMKDQELKKYHILPGQMVPTYQYILLDPGRLYHTKGKSDPSDMFSGGCVFIDRSSGYGSINHQVAINATETVKLKLTFEREAQSRIVLIKGYYTDDGIFNVSDFMEELLKKYQKIRFSGASASHQNGAEEHVTNIVVTMESNMLMHADPICPEERISTDLWPMIMYYAVWVYNPIPGMHYGLSAIEIWSRLRFEPVSETLSNCHVWGCPTYVLEPKLQNPGLNIPNWAPRSRIWVNMGFNKMHSTQVGLDINLLTGSISQHYHVVFDDMFSTVLSSTAADPEVCIRLVTSSNSRIQVILDQEDDLELDD